MSDDHLEEPARLLFEMLPDGCVELTALVELDYGYSQIQLFSLDSNGQKQQYRPDTDVFEDQLLSLSSSLLKMRDGLHEETAGQKIAGCELLVRPDGSFKYKLVYPDS